MRPHTNQQNLCSSQNYQQKEDSTSRCIMFPEEKIRQLIDEVQSVPCLWDKSHADYKRHELRDRAWEKIGLILTVSGDEAKTKWNYLRDQFCLKMKKLPSGSGTSDAAVKWRYLESMSFLKATVKPRKSESNFNSLKIVGVDIDNGIFDTEEPEFNRFEEETEDFRPKSSDSVTPQSLHHYQQSSGSAQSKQKRADSDAEINSLIAERLKRHAPKSEESSFGEFVAENLAQMPKLIRLETCAKVTELLFQAHKKVEKLNENSD